MPRRITFFLILILLCALLPGGGRAGHAWAATQLAVLYPEVREPYRSVFQTILRGIDSENPSTIRHYPLPKDFQADQVKQWVSRERPASVIALGSRGFRAAQQLDSNIPIVAGSVLMPPGSLPGISLAASPKRLFNELKNLVPDARRIFVVYSPAMNGWLIKDARRAAAARGLELQAYPAEDLREAVTLYRDLIKKTVRGHDAIWLPLDHITSDDRVVLPMLLEAAWTRKFVLFSSKPGHAQKGALFSFSPDNFALGKRLAQMATAAANSRQSAALVPMQDLQMAVNLRTAAHLGLNFSAEQQEAIKLKFP